MERYWLCEKKNHYKMNRKTELVSVARERDPN